MRRYVVFSLLFLALSLSALTNAETLTPKFDDYGVKDKSSKRVSNVRIVSTQDKTYRAMLSAAIGQKPNFAGHFVMVEFGCGASCVRAAAIDTKTGAIYWLPFTVCCFPSEVEEPISYTLDSSLIEVRGMRDEKGGGTYYYQFIRGRFDLVKEIEGP